jgi:chromatin segregation and condensation protein Rec8/ScpA/Scc1 (kleisin family)
VQLPVFSGSFGALLECVRRQKVNLLEVPLAPICEAYVAHALSLAAQDEDQLDAAAVALAALSYLLERKALLLIPGSGDQTVEEPEEPFELPEPFISEFMPLIEEFRNRERMRAEVFFRPNAGSRTYELPFDAGDLTIDDLARAFEAVMERAQSITSRLNKRPARSLAEQMLRVASCLTREWTTIRDLALGDLDRAEAVWWFLALLELIRLGRAKVKMLGTEPHFRGVA